METSSKTIITGAIGVASSFLVEKAIPSDPAEIANITQVIVQVVIGILTILKLFKKKK